MPRMFAICGDSGSGKTTMAAILDNYLTNSTIHECDRYHKWERGNIHWDEFTHLNTSANHISWMINDAMELKAGNNISCRDYDHKTGKFTEDKEIRSCENIILCGLHTFYCPEEMFVLKIFMDTADDLKTQWKISRDTSKRGHSTKTVKDQITDDNAYPIIQEGDQFFVLYKNGEKIPYNQLQGEGRVSSIFTASQYDKARGKIPDAQFFKMEDELEKTKQTILTFNDMFDVIVRGGETFEGKKNSILARVKIFSGQSDKLTDGEKAQLEKEGSLRRLIGQSRLALFGPGVLTEFEQQLAKVALVGNPDFAVIDVVRTLLTRASRSEISKYDLLGKRVQNQRRKRRDPGDKTDTLFDYTTLPLFKEEESIDENDTGGNET